MKKLQSLSALLACLSIALTPGIAAAAVRSHAVTLTPFAGGYLFEGNQDLDAGPLYGVGLGYNLSSHWGVEGVYNQSDAETDDALPSQDVEFSSLRLDLLYHFRPDGMFVPYVAAGPGAQRLESENGAQDNDLLFNYGLGFKLFFNDYVAFRGDVRHVLNSNATDDVKKHEVFHNLSYTAGLSFQLGGTEKAPVPRDTDGDGVADSYDLCPATQPGAPVDQNGCPLEAKVEAAVATRPDADGDGVENEHDKCPNTPSDIPVNTYGCPRDSDGDGVFDFEDRCPDTPPGTAADADGCPVPAPVAAPAPASMTLQLEFAYGEAAVRPEFETDLQAAADFIKAHPDGRILIEGHTDSIGSVESNLALSKARATEVRRYLVEKYSLDAGRIETEGFGEARPAADNATPEGRQSNRRVVITVLPGH